MMISIFAAVVIAAFDAFSGCVISKTPLARLVIGFALLGVLLLAPKTSTYDPTQHATFIPPTILRESIPPVALTTLTVDAPANATHVMYWAATAGTLSKNRADAYGTFENSGLVQVSGGRATLRVQCPGNYTRLGSPVPKHVEFRYLYKDGSTSEVKTAYIKC